MIQEMNRNLRYIFSLILVVWMAILSSVIHTMHDHGETDLQGYAGVCSNQACCFSINNSHSCRPETRSHLSLQRFYGEHICPACHYLALCKSATFDNGLTENSEFLCNEKYFYYKSVVYRTYACQPSIPRSPPRA